MATADGFLEVARTLVGHADKPEHLRRAISSAYYAAFHAIVDAAAPIIFADPGTQLQARSWFNHGDMLKVTNAIGSAPPAPERLEAWLASGGRKYGFTKKPDRRIGELCGQFSQLLEARTKADYFHTSTPGLHEVHSAIGKAQSLIETVAACANSSPCDEDFVLLVTAMLHASINPRRGSN
jgi:uncharacterized protein (UPF0332 family)